MNLNIIIEGPDNVGKSTLIRGLKKHFKDTIFHVLHYSALNCDKSKMMEMSQKYYKQMFSLLRSDINFICDRSYIGEFVYGPLYRNYTESDLQVYTDMELSLISCDKPTIIVYLHDDVQNLIDRDDGLSISNKPEMIKKELDLYKKTISQSKLPHIEVKSTNEEETLQKVIRGLDNLTEGYLEFKGCMNEN